MTGTNAPDARKAVDIVRIALGIAGLVAIVLGAIIVFDPAGTLETMTKVIAIAFAVLAILVGVVYLAVAIFSITLPGGKRALRGLLGAVYLAAGIVVLVYPVEVGLALAALLSIIVGISWLVEGVVALMTLGDARSKGFSIVYAVLSLIAGVTLVVAPLSGAATLWLLLGLAMLVMGVLQVIRAFKVKHDVAETIIIQAP